jgi:hypothetical protein
LPAAQRGAELFPLSVTSPKAHGVDNATSANNDINNHKPIPNRFLFARAPREDAGIWVGSITSTGLAVTP